MINTLIAVLVAMFATGCAQASVKYKTLPTTPPAQATDKGELPSNSMGKKDSSKEASKEEDSSPKFHLQKSTIVLQGQTDATPSAAPTVEAQPNAPPAVKPTSTATDNNKAKSLKGVSGVVVSKKGSPAPAELNSLKNKVEALSVPGEDQSALYAVVPKDKWFGLVATNLSIEYVPNSRLIKTIGSTVDDNRLKVMQAIGSGVVSLAGMAVLGEGKDLRPPVFIDFVPKELDGDYKAIEDQPEGWWYRVIDNSPNLDGVGTQSYFDNHSDSKWFTSTSTFPKSACRNVILSIAYSVGVKPGVNSAALQFPLTVADPSLLWLYELPNKGKITSHEICGADIAPDKDSSSTAWDLLSEAFKQAKAVYDVKHPKK